MSTPMLTCPGCHRTVKNILGDLQVAVGVQGMCFECATPFIVTPEGLEIEPNPIDHPLADWVKRANTRLTPDPPPIVPKVFHTRDVIDEDGEAHPMFLNIPLGSLAYVDERHIVYAGEPCPVAYPRYVKLPMDLIWTQFPEVDDTAWGWCPTSLLGDLH